MSPLASRHLASIGLQRLIAILLISLLSQSCNRQHRSDPKAQITALAIACKLYAGDGDGLYPESMEHLRKSKAIKQIPKYENMDGTSADFILIGGFMEVDADDWVILASPEELGKSNRWIATLRCDVKSLPSREVEILLNKSREFVKENQEKMHKKGT